VIGETDSPSRAGLARFACVPQIIAAGREPASAMTYQFGRSHGSAVNALTGAVSRLDVPSRYLFGN
jgi:hypothetical protein